jgi:hypothetical protein
MKLDAISYAVLVVLSGLLFVMGTCVSFEVGVCGLLLVIALEAAL